AAGTVHRLDPGIRRSPAGPGPIGKELGQLGPNDIVELGRAGRGQQACGGLMTMRAGRRVAISAGSLAVLLGALDTYVVITIMRDIMNSVGIPVNKLQRITWIVTL